MNNMTYTSNIKMYLKNYYQGKATSGQESLFYNNIFFDKCIIDVDKALSR